MGSMCLRVAGFFLAIAACAAPPNLAPAILTFPDLKALEAKVAAHPEDRDAAELLGKNYAIAIVGVTEFNRYGSPTSFGVSGEAAAYSRNALAQTHNGAVLGPAGIALWNYGVTRRPNNDINDLAQGCVEHAIAMEPAEGKWRSQHIQMTLSREQFKLWSPLATKDALPLVQKDFAVLTGMQRDFALDRVALLEYRAGDLAQAEALARELLGPSGGKFANGEALFKGNEVLGLVALKRGDVAGAKQYLKLSGETKGSPALDSFGPNMALASALIDAGEKDAVVAFFEQCRTFWKMENGKLREWTVLVQGGLKPNFGGNGVY